MKKRDAMKIIILGNLGYIGPAVTQQFRLSFPNAELIGFDIGYFAHCLSHPAHLPEAQLDRFLVQIDVPYPDRDTEKDILIATTGATENEATAVFTSQELLDAQTLLRRMPVGDNIVEMILDLVRSCRPDDDASAAIRDNISWGPGPRAAQALMLTVRAQALLSGRLAPSAEDVMVMAVPVLEHRMALSFAARARGVSITDIITDVAVSITQTQAAVA